MFFISYSLLSIVFSQKMEIEKQNKKTGASNNFELFIIGLSFSFN
jgi:hypothetical protein